LSNEETRPSGPSAGMKRRGIVILPIVIVLLAVAFAFWLAGRNRVSTDDAQVEGDIVPISSRVTGYVDTIAVRDNERVGAGRLLVQLDRRDLDARLRRSEGDVAMQRAQALAAAEQVSLVERTAPAGERQAQAGVELAGAGIGAAESLLASAEAQHRSAKAGVETAAAAVESARSDLEAAKSQVQAAEAGVRQVQADVTSAEAQARRTAADASRFRELQAGGAVSRQQLDAMETADTSAQAALESARQRASGARAMVEQAKARRSGAEAGLKQAKTRLAAAVAAAAQAKAGVGQARAAVSQARSRLGEAEAGQSAARTAPQQIAISAAQNRAAAARIRQAAADLHNARLQYTYTTIRAPVSGVVSKKSVQPGQFVQPGQLLMALVPLERVWVVANFKETQIARMRPGQRAEVEVDTYEGRELRGRVLSIGAATGAKFSLLPPENATGNFVKVVQRIPVKIVLDRPLPRGTILRPGMNVRATVHLRGGRG